MITPLQARRVDVANLMVAKGSNFLLTALLFALLARGMDTRAFGEFGYWWSMALMVGGVLLGGVSSAVVRAAAVHGSLRQLLAPLQQAGLAVLAVAATVVALAAVGPFDTALAALLGAVALFGISVQAQTVLLALLRAVEATRANAFASLAIVAVVPLALHATLGDERRLTTVFGALAATFVLGTAVALAIARSRIEHLFVQPAQEPLALSHFLANASAFTAINVFTYAIVNVDFTLFRQIGTSSDFAVMATAKIFFERFVLPALLVFAGAVSLRVLRHPHDASGPPARLQATLTPRLAAGAVVTIAALALGYTFFASTMRGDARTIGFGWAACASGGYLLFAVNGILFDLLVVRRRLVAVVVHVAAFLALGCAVQALAIARLGIPGWAIGWLLFNAVVLAVLAREGVELRLPRRAGLRCTENPVEDR